MHAILITDNGRGGRFHTSSNGDPLVAVTETELRYLSREAQYLGESAQLVDLGCNWPYSVTTVSEEHRSDPFYPPADVLAYDQAA